MHASDLGSIVVKEVLNRGNTNAADVNEVILGQVRKNELFFFVYDQQIVSSLYV